VILLIRVSDNKTINVQYGVIFVRQFPANICIRWQDQQIKDNCPVSSHAQCNPLTKSRITFMTVILSPKGVATNVLIPPGT